MQSTEKDAGSLLQRHRRCVEVTIHTYERGCMQSTKEMQCNVNKRIHSICCLVFYRQVPRTKGILPFDVAQYLCVMCVDLVIGF